MYIKSKNVKTFYKIITRLPAIKEVRAQHICWLSEGVAEGGWVGGVFVFCVWHALSRTRKNGVNVLKLASKLLWSICPSQEKEQPSQLGAHRHITNTHIYIHTCTHSLAHVKKSESHLRNCNVCRKSQEISCNMFGFKPNLTSSYILFVYISGMWVCACVSGVQNKLTFDSGIKWLK